MEVQLALYLNNGEKYPCRLAMHLGKTLRIIDGVKEMMIAAGFVDVVKRRLKVPIPSWAKDRRSKELGLVI